MHLGSLARIGGNQGRIRLPLIQMQRNGAGVGNDLIPIHQHGDLALAGQPEHSHLADTGGHLHGAETQPLGLQHHPHLETKRGMAELMQLQHVQNSHGPGRVASRFASTPEPCGSFSSTSPVTPVT